jgi:hypothetical protein
MKPATLALALSLVAVTAAPAAVAQNDPTLRPQLVEVEPTPGEVGPSDEWVELANPSPLPMDTDGLYLTDHDPCFAPGEGYVEEYRWPLNVTLPAHGVLAVELPDQCLTLSDRGDEVALEDGREQVLDEVAYGNDGELPTPDRPHTLSACHELGQQYGAWALEMATPNGANPRCSSTTPAGLPGH